MPRGLFITGTGTGVGKTYVAALVARALHSAGKRVGVYKPAASGCQVCAGRLVSPDAEALWHAAGQSGPIERVCPQMFAAPLAPHLAARAEGRRIDATLLRSGFEYWQSTCEFILVEGAGGLMSPIGDDAYNADLAAEFGLSLLVVAANELGTINATLQTLITAQTIRGGMPVAGVVLNWPTRAEDDPSTASNCDELALRCSAPVLAEVGYNGQFDREVDWWKLGGG
jgi:dethiobiotin synthetase